MTAIRQMTYRPHDPAATDVEVMSFERLRRLNDGTSQRADFHVVALVADGAGRAVIDFEHCVLGPRTVVWIPPGTVHRWDRIGDVNGTLVLFVTTAPVTAATRQLAAASRPAASWHVDDDWHLLSTAVGHLQTEVAASGTTEIPRLLLSVLLARLRPPSAATTGGDHPLFRRFQATVEEHFRDHHDAGHYADVLGYAPRTLSRAVLAATGRTPKAYLTERLTLEAKRLLAHDRFTAVRCARELGFRDASNFSAFFLASTGERPGAWQRANGFWRPD